MANIFGTGDNKAMENVIAAASKIMMGVQDADTDAAQTEDDHPIVAAAKEEVAVESADLDSPAVEKSLKHDCATHVVHKEHGEGRCIPGMHTLEETSELEGVVTHYDVMFKEGIVKDVAIDDLEIMAEMSHGHAKKKK
tara:strand:- start:301 stop:714 length:414 start_codon:yes stop_codon:yes gene_type:complete